MQNQSTMIVADAIVLEDGDNLAEPSTPSAPAHYHDYGDIPVVQAIDPTETYDIECDMQTVRLDADHIVPIPEQSQQVPRKRPEFVSVIFVNKASYANSNANKGILGIRLERASDGRLRLSRIDPSSPFTETAVQVGDTLISINNTTCDKMSADSFWQPCHFATE